VRRRLSAIVAAAAACASFAACTSSDAPIDAAAENRLLETARAGVAAKNWGDAIDAAESLYEKSRDPLRKQEALYLAGEARFADESYVKAYRHYETLLKDFPYSTFVPKIEEHVFAIGAYYLGQSPWFLFGDLFSGRERGAEVMRQFVASYPNSKRADDALAQVAAYRFERKEYDLAVVFYQQLARSYPDSEWADLAAFRRAECWRFESRGAGYDERALLRAAAEYRRYLSERPKGNFSDRARDLGLAMDEAVAECELKIARFYVARDQDPGARIHFANVALAYPATKAAAVARTELASRNWDLSINSLDTLRLSASESSDWVGENLENRQGLK
jgi:outer membrane protein assembly factor BamD (BamD/ComL family)